MSRELKEGLESAKKWHGFGSPEHNAITQAIAEIDRLQSLLGGGWQDISTAPKDGTVILVYANQGHGNGIHAARYYPDYIGSGYGHFWIAAFYQNLGSGISGQVTHWRPLPLKPTGEL